MNQVRWSKGERVLANQTVKIDGKPVIIKNRLYLVHRTKWSCCQQVVDINYLHPKPIVRTCAQCSNRSSSSRRVLIPSSYFRRQGEKADKLHEQINDLQVFFRKLDRESFIP